MTGSSSALRIGSLIRLASSLRGAFRDLLSQEFTYSVGHLAAIANGCLFAPSLLTFWFVNGVVDFSTAFAIGAVTTPAGLQVRLYAYVLLVPAFVLARVSIHLAHPVHRRQVLAGRCPNVRLLSLDWISLGILATGLPLAIQNLGPWIAMNVIFVFGVFAIPRYLPARSANPFKLLSIVVGGLVFIYATYGDALTAVPPPASTLGPLATLSLAPDTTELLLRVANSLLVGPLVVGSFGLILNHVLTRPELIDVPVIRVTVPKRDSDHVVVLSAAFGTVFYLVVVAVVTGRLIVLP